MKKRSFLFVVLVAVTVCLGCSSNRFLVTKNGRASYFATNREALHEMLCDSGDFKKVLAAAPELPAATSNGLYYYTCEKPDAKKAQALFVSLTPAQRKDMLNAFMGQGYDINIWPCT